MRQRIVPVLTGLALMLAADLSLAATPSAAPNVVLILADDMGYSDIGSFGGEIDTPNLDRLAAEGIRFSQFYSAARCSPTRAALLTGRYPHRVQMGHLAGQRFAGIDGYRGDLDQAAPTIAERLRSAGYRSYMAGKWHLSRHGASDLGGADIAGLPNTPTRRGFDAFYGTLLGGNNYFSPQYLFRDTARARATADGYYYTDAISAEATQQIGDHSARSPAQPFFLYVAYTAPHWPIQAPAATIKKYRARYQQGWQAVRAQRQAALAAQRVIDARWPLAALDAPFPSWADTPDRAWEVERMAVHAAMVDHLDQGVGLVLEALDRAHLADNTLVLFLSDNGASAEAFPATLSPALLERFRPFTGKYAPASGEPLQIGNNPAVMPGDRTTLQSIGPRWAQVSNTPFRKYKSWVHEGGIATPLLARWPAGQGGPPGRVIHEPGHVIDLLPTIAQAAGLSMRRTGQVQPAVDGVSLISALRGHRHRRGPIFFEHEGHRAVRDGRWKLIAAAGEDWALYDMKLDRTETQDLASRYPRRARRLARRFGAWAQASGVRPWPAVLAAAKARD